MQKHLENLLKELGVSDTLDPYSSLPWQVCNDNSDICCSAEIRSLDGETNEIEIELMMQYLNAQGDQKPIDLILWMFIKADPDGTYKIKKCKLRGEDFVGSVSGWEDKIKRFLKTCFARLNRQEIPDIDDLLEKALANEEEDEDSEGKGGGYSKDYEKEALTVKDMNFQFAPGS